MVDSALEAIDKALEEAVALLADDSISSDERAEAERIRAALVLARPIAEEAETLLKGLR